MVVYQVLTLFLAFGSAPESINISTSFTIPFSDASYILLSRDLSTVKLEGLAEFPPPKAPSLMPADIEKRLFAAVGDAPTINDENGDEGKLEPILVVSGKRD